MVLAFQIDSKLNEPAGLGCTHCAKICRRKIRLESCDSIVVWQVWCNLPLVASAFGGRHDNKYVEQIKL